MKGVPLEMRLQKTGFCSAGVLSPWPSLSTAVVKQAALLEGAMWQGMGQIQTTARKERRFLVQQPTRNRILPTNPEWTGKWVLPHLSLDWVSASWETIRQGHMGEPGLDS